MNADHRLNRLWKELSTLWRMGRVLTAAALCCALLVHITPARAACTITGTVFRDFNANGFQDGREPGVSGAGLVLRAYSAAGGILGQTNVFAADGSYTLNLAGAPDGEVRLEFTNLPDYLASGRFGANSLTTVTFTDCSGGGTPTVDLAVSNPSEYCHIDTPMMATTCFNRFDQLMPPARDSSAMIMFPYTATGDDPDTVMATSGQIGTAYGLGYHRRSASFFVSSYVKRHAGLGPDDNDPATFGTTTGGIYQVSVTPPFATRLFMDLNTYPGLATGPIPHTASGPTSPTSCTQPAGYRPPGAPYSCWEYDTIAYDAVGTTGLGDLDISEDDLAIWVVNLTTRQLLEIPIGLTPTAPPAAAISRYPLTTLPDLVSGPNACPSVNDLRPFGLGLRDFRVYVGLVCSAESTQQTDDLFAYVISMDSLNPALGFRLDLSFPLNYPRRCLDNAPACPAGRAAPWNPWSSGAPWPPPDPDPVNPAWPTLQIYPEPMLVDIVFDNEDMILGFRDRMGDRTGNQTPDPFDYAAPELYSGIAGGDVLRACRNAAGAWVLENNGTCGGVTTGGAGNNEGPGGGEFYFHDRNNPNIPVDGPARHDEIMMGGLAQVPGAANFVSTAIDPLCENCGPSPLHDNGIVTTSHDTGQRVNSYRIFDGALGPAGGILFGKSNGLGDLELVCAPPPLEIGNRVWEDLDRNGRQDPGEVPIAGAILQLYMDTDGDNTADTLVGRTTTNGQGEYYFNEQNIFIAGLLGAVPNVTFLDINANLIWDDFEPRGLLANTVYEIRFDDPANYGGGPLTPYFITPARTTTLGDGNDPLRDSDGTNPTPLSRVSAANFPIRVLRTPNYGVNDHTYDFGFSLQPPVTPTPPVSMGTPGLPLALAKAVNPPFALPGQTVAWTITVTNQGNVAATNVVVEDTLPGELEIIPPIPANVVVNGQNVRITFASIAPGASVSVTINTRIRANVPVPFILENDARLDGLRAKASIVSAGQLPATGQSILQRVRIPLAVMTGLLLAGLGWWMLRGSQ